MGYRSADRRCRFDADTLVNDWLSDQHSADAPNLGGILGTNEIDTDIDDETDQSGGQSLEDDYSLLTTTDPTTGVVTKLFSGDSVQDKSSSQAGIHDSDTSNSNLATTLSQGPPTVTVNNGNGTDIETDYSLGNDTTKTGGNISLSVVGSPAAGQTENINEKIQLGGNDQDQENSNGGSEEDFASSYNGTPGTAASSDTISGNETLKDKDIGNQTVGIIGNSTISILDPTTNLTTTDTLIDNGSLKVGYNGNDTLTDNHPHSAITTAGEDDLTNDDQMKETLNGNDQSTETLTVNGTTPDGTTVNSTETIGDKGTLIGNTTDHDTGNGTVTGQLANLSVTESDTDVSGDDIKTGDQTTDTLDFQSSGTDPTTGLQQSVTIDDNSTDQENDEEIDSDTDTEVNSTGNAVTGAPVVATNDDNFDDTLIESGQSTDAPTIVINTQGTDSQGEQVTSQEGILLVGNATATVNDEDIGEDTSGIAGKPATADTETVDADVLSHATVEDVLGGSIVSVDPNTGIKTTTTDNLSITGTDDEHDHEDETDVRSAGSPDQDTFAQTNTDPLLLVWVITESVISALPDGSQAAPPTNDNTSGNQTIQANDTLTNGANGQITGAPTASDPNSANRFAQNAAPLVNVGGQQSEIAGPQIIGESASAVAATGLEDEAGFVADEVEDKKTQNAALPKVLPTGSGDGSGGNTGLNGSGPTSGSSQSSSGGPATAVLQTENMALTVEQEVQACKDADERRLQMWGDNEYIAGAAVRYKKEAASRDILGGAASAAVTVLENPRVQGALLIVGSIGEGVTASGLLVAPDPTLLTKVGAGALYLHAVDNGGTGWYMLVTGERDRTILSQAVQAGAVNIFNVDPRTGEIIGEVTNSVAGIGGTAWAGYRLAALQSGGALADAAEVFGPGIGRSGYSTTAEFDAAVGGKYQQLVDRGYADTMDLVARGLVKNDPTVIGSRVDSIARTGLRDWLRNVEEIQEGPGQIIQVNRRLYNLVGTGAYRIPDVYIPGARSIYDATIADKSIVLPQTIAFRIFSGGGNITIIRPSTLVTPFAKGSYGLYFP